MPKTIAYTVSMSVENKFIHLASGKKMLTDEITTCNSITEVQDNDNDS